MGNNLLLTIGGLMLLGLFFLSGNRKVLESGGAATENEFAMTAVALGQSVIDEAKARAFDEAALAGAVSSRTDLTTNGALGRDGGAESVPVPDVNTGSGFSSATKFDDVDDYNGYSRTVSTVRAIGYEVSVVVSYAEETNPDVQAATKTFCKNMTVTVTHPNVSMPITVSYPFVY